MMKKYFVFLLLMQLSVFSYGQIIADHTVVDRYADIPQYYIDQVKKMWLSYAGESHSGAIRSGLSALEVLNAAYAVSVVESGVPEPYTAANLRASRATWGDVNNGSGWIYEYGEEDWYTSATAIARTKAGLLYCKNNGPALSAFGFGWCWDACWINGLGGSPDPVTGNYWAGASEGGPEGNLRWGLDDADNVLTGNSVNMDTYLRATQEYIDYCAANGIATKVFFTTGPVDTYVDETGYQNHLKQEHIRAYVEAHPATILFDYADILCYDDNGIMTTTAWNGHIYPIITTKNLTPTVAAYHISNAGALRLAKAMWWMLARIAGWDGTAGSSWLGVTTDWNAATNWSSGSVPGPATDVIIPDVVNSPHVNIADAQCNNLTVNTSAGLQIDAGQALTVNGNLTNNGAFTIESDGTAGSGSLIVAGTSTGNITYNRTMPASMYHYISSPVSSATLPSGPAYWFWDEPSGKWLVTTACESGKGYTMLADGSKVSFTGTVAASAVQTGTAPYYSAEQRYVNERGVWGGGGWNLLGNPFTSAMDATLFLGTNAVSLDPSYQAVYIFTGSEYYYIASVIPGFTGSGTFSSTSVQAGQGFYVLANYDGVQFSFTSAMQTHNAVAPMTKSAGASEAWPGIQLKLKYGDNERSTLMVFNEQMTAGLDPGYDVGLMSSGQEAEIYTALTEKDNSVNYARQALSTAGCDRNLIPVGIDCEKGGEVTFSAFIIPLQNYKFCLEDRVTGTVTDLATATYKVTLPAQTYGTGRFYLKALSTITGTDPLPGNPDPLALRVWMSGDRVIIRGDVSERAVCSVFDLQGRKLTETGLTGGDLNSVSLPSGSKGVYLVRVTDGLKVTARKVVVL